MTKQVETKKPDEDFMTKKWRPMMAVTYMIINICDFVLFPVLFTTVQFWEIAAANDAFRQWQPMTLQGGGLIHMAFGAILGVAAWTRGQEKVATINNGAPTTGTPTPTAPVTEQKPYVPSFESSATTVPVNGSGKKMVPQEAQPLI